MKNICTLFLIAVTLVASAPQLMAQMKDEDVRKRLDYIYGGQADRVRAELPELEKNHPNDPGVKYLEAVLTSDGSQAARRYQAIVDQFPKSTWADDALYKVYQYYYSVGLYKTADQKMDELKKNYPNSIYVAGAVEPQQAPAEPPTAKPAATASSPATTEKKAPAAAPVPSLARGKYAVQTGAFSTRQAAQKQIDLLSGAGYTVVLSTKQSGEKQLFAVTIEGFATEKEARDAIAKLKEKQNIQSMIVIR